MVVKLGEVKFDDPLDDLLAIAEWMLALFYVKKLKNLDNKKIFDITTKHLPDLLELLFIDFVLLFFVFFMPKIQNAMNYLKKNVYNMIITSHSSSASF